MAAKIVAEKLIVQLLDETPTEQGLLRRFRWGRVPAQSAVAADWFSSATEGTGEDLLAAVGESPCPMTLLLPGRQVVTLSIPYNKKAARHFMQTLPYQIEEDVLGDVTDLHFAVGKPGPDTVTVAYVNNYWFADLLEWFRDGHLNVNQCIPDYQCLKVADHVASNNEDEARLALWFTGREVLGHSDCGMGFTIAQSLAQPLLKKHLVDEQGVPISSQLTVYVSTEAVQETIQRDTMPPMDYQVVVGSPGLDTQLSNPLNFCSGQYGQALPLQRWWKEIQPLVYVAAAAVLVFFVATFADIYSMQRQAEANHQQMLSAYRTVIPRGPAVDPVKLLRSKLGRSQVATQKQSHSVLLLAKVAPILSAQGVTLTTLNYSNREQSLRINVTADSFNAIETLRQALSGAGVVAELQGSNAAEQGFQARLRITLEEKHRG